MLVTNKLLSSLVTKSFDLSEEDVTIYENRISFTMANEQDFCLISLELISGSDEVNEDDLSEMVLISIQFTDRKGNYLDFFKIGVERLLRARYILENLVRHGNLRIIEGTPGENNYLHIILTRFVDVNLQDVLQTFHNGIPCELIHAIIRLFGEWERLNGILATIANESVSDTYEEVELLLTQPWGSA